MSKNILFEYSKTGEINLQNLVIENETLRSTLNSLAEGVVVADKFGNFLFMNPVAEKIIGLGPQNVGQEEWSKVYGCFHADQKTPYLPEELPLSRAIQGEEICDEIMYIKNPERPDGVFGGLPWVVWVQGGFRECRV